MVNTLENLLVKLLAILFIGVVYTLIAVVLAIVITSTTFLVLGILFPVTGVMFWWLAAGPNAALVYSIGWLLTFLLVTHSRM